MIQFNYITPATGALATYHVIQNIQLDYLAQQTTVTVASYVDAGNYRAGKFPLYTQAIALPGLPANDTDPRVSAYRDLVAARPVDGTAETNPARWLFAGARLDDVPASAGSEPTQNNEEETQE